MQCRSWVFYLRHSANASCAIEVATAAFMLFRQQVAKVPCSQSYMVLQISTYLTLTLRHGTSHFYTIYTGISKINSQYGNLKDQMKLDLCICEALSYTYVPWKPYLWA